MIFDNLGDIKEGEILRHDSSGYLIRWQGPYGMDQSYFTPDVVNRLAGAPTQPEVQPSPIPVRPVCRPD